MNCVALTSSVSYALYLERCLCVEGDSLLDFDMFCAYIANILDFSDSDCRFGLLVLSVRVARNKFSCETKQKSNSSN